MSKYVINKIGDLATITSSKRIFLSDYVESGIPFWRSKEVIEQFKGNNISNELFITADKYNEIKNKFGVPSPNDILITSVGTIGIPYLVKKEDVFYFKDGNLTWVKNIKPNVEPLYFFKWITSPIGKGIINNFLIGSSQKALTIDSLKKIPIQLPPLPTQQKIAQILSAYDDLIENNLKRINLLEEMAQMTYEQWFVRMKFPNHETIPIDAETGLPEGWTEGDISLICHVNNDSIKKKTAPENIRYIDIASVNTGSYENPQELEYASAPSRARRRLKYGDTIFSTVRPNRKIYSCIMEHDPFLVASTGFAVLTPKIKDTYSFVYLSVANQSFVEKAVSVAGGAAYPAVNQSDFEQIKIIVPPEKIIKEFSDLVNNNFIISSNLKQQNRYLKEARDILLPRLMTGIIDVDKINLPKPLEKNTHTAPSNTKEAIPSEC